MPPKVSVIIPAFNPGQLLEQAVSSVLAQTYKEFEIVIVDDGSTEDLRQYLGNDPRIHLVRQDNWGLSVARNVGIANSTADLIAFIDADDVWEPTKLEDQIAVHNQNPKVALTYTNFTIIDELGQNKGDGWSRPLSGYEELLLGCCICVSSVMVRRDCLQRIGLFDPMFFAVQDYDLWLRLSFKHKMQHLDKFLVRYRMHSANMSHNYLRTAKETENILLKHMRHAQATGNRNAERAARTGLFNIRNTFAHQAFENCRKHFRKNEFSLFARHLWTTIALSRSLNIPLRSLMRFDSLNAPARH